MSLLDGRGFPPFLAFFGEHLRLRWLPRMCAALLALPIEQIRVVDRPRIDRDVRASGENAGDRHLELLAGAGVWDAGCLDDLLGHMPRRQLRANLVADLVRQRILESVAR